MNAISDIVSALERLEDEVPNLDKSELESRLSDLEQDARNILEGSLSDIEQKVEDLADGIHALRGDA